MAKFQLDTKKIGETTDYITNIPFGFTPSVGELLELKKLHNILTEYFEYLNPPAKNK